MKEDVINWFGSIEEYKNYHAIVHETKKVKCFFDGDNDS